MEGKHCMPLWYNRGGKHTWWPDSNFAHGSNWSIKEVSYKHIKDQPNFFCSVSGGHVISRICPPRKVRHLEGENAHWSGHGQPFFSFFFLCYNRKPHLSKFLVFSRKQQKLSEENQWLRTSSNLWILCKHCTWLNLVVDIGIIETHLSSKLILLMAFYFVNTSLPPTLMRSTTTYMSMQGMASCLIQCCLFSSFL